MKISKIPIEDKTKERILYKHGIRASRVKEMTLVPYGLKTRENRYMAIGYSQRFITSVNERKDKRICKKEKIWL